MQSMSQTITGALFAKRVPIPAASPQKAMPTVWLDRWRSYFRTFRSILLIICLHNMGGSQAIFAQWSSDPSVNNPISTATNGQYAPVIISDDAGGAIITWYDNRNGAGHNNDIYVQRINACGVVQWTVDGLAICSEINSQWIPCIVSDGEGGAIITWSDNRSGSNYDIYAQRIDATGTVQWGAGGVAVCTEKSDQFSIATVSDGAGGVIVTWYDSRNGNGDNIYAQRLNAAGTVQWTANGVAVCTAANGQESPSIVSDGSGGAIITWSDSRNPTAADIYAQRVDAAGTIQWTTNGVAICTAANAQFWPTIISDRSGGAILTWNDRRGGTHYDIYAQRINATGVVQWTANGVVICTAINDQLVPNITGDDENGAIITWTDNRSGSNNDIYAQRVNGSGAVQWTLDGVPVRTATKSQFGPIIAPDGTGGAIICRNEQATGSYYDIFAQRISASGVAQWTAGGISVSTAPNNQYNPTITADGSNGAIITWVDVRSGDFDIYAQNVNSNGTIGHNTPLPGAVSIGPDTSICEGNSLVLNAHRGYATYRWNNGSVDSVLVVSSPGRYYIDVTDACGNFSSDTVIVSQAAPPFIDIGPDRTTCNNDTLHLAAQAGFLDYEWGPAYNMNTSSNRQVIVRPTVDTFYYVKAGNTAGCFAYDTIRIKVYQSPAIDLGGDISLCAGDSAVLNAGPGFAEYQWSNGISSQQIFANTAGSYSVIGTTSEGCRSYDTLNVVNIWSNPAGFLPADTTICNFGTLALKPAASFSRYAWNNNSSATYINITAPGLYWLQVTDANNCSGRDSILVSPVDCTQRFYIPNAFTPDGNGRNDYFKPFISGVVKHYMFTIYNRWGQVVFASNDRYQGWNGTFRETGQFANVFAWICTYQLEGESVKQEKGTVTVIR